MPSLARNPIWGQFYLSTWHNIMADFNLFIFWFDVCLAQSDTGSEVLYTNVQLSQTSDQQKFIQVLGCVRQQTESDLHKSRADAAMGNRLRELRRSTGRGSALFLSLHSLRTKQRYNTSKKQHPEQEVAFVCYMNVLVNADRHMNHFSFFGGTWKEIARIKVSFVSHGNVRGCFIRALNVCHSCLPYSLVQREYYQIIKGSSFLTTSFLCKWILNDVLRSIKIINVQWYVVA
jgi:hypothetical protein